MKLKSFKFFFSLSIILLFASILKGEEKIDIRQNTKEKKNNVKIETDQNSFVKGNEIYKLYSGVPVAVGIITGRRSFLDYFLSPFLNKITFSLSER